MTRRFLLTAFFLFALAFGARPALADGEVRGNSRGGVITGVDAAERTAIFQPNGSAEVLTLKLDDALDPLRVPVGRKVLAYTRMEHGIEKVHEISETFLDLTLGAVFALLIIGFVGGLLSGFIGSGGAFVLTPSMMSMGVPAAVAVASNMCHKFPKALVGAYKRHQYGQVDLKLGLVLAVSAIAGVQLGIMIQEAVLDRWGGAGSNLYVSLVFVGVLVVVGSFVTRDAWRLACGCAGNRTSRAAQILQKLRIPPMLHFRTAGVSASAWVTVPIGLGTGVLAATIAVGGFIGVPGMIYLLGVTATVASATELVVAFVMGLWASIQWGMNGLIDIRLALLLLATSLVGVQIGALGTTYVKDHVIKLVMGIVMLIVAVSRAAKVPVYLADLEAVKLGPTATAVLDRISFWALVAALAAAGIMVSWALVRGMRRARQGAKPEHEAPNAPEAAED